MTQKEQKTEVSSQLTGNVNSVFRSVCGYHLILSFLTFNCVLNRKFAPLVDSCRELCAGHQQLVAHF